ncbi:MAG: zinc transporter ZntB, partial [Plesiomonas sp.]
MQLNDVLVEGAVTKMFFDGKGGALPMNAATNAIPSLPAWLHLDYSHPQSAEWIKNSDVLPEGV